MILNLLGALQAMLWPGTAEYQQEMVYWQCV